MQWLWESYQISTRLYGEPQKTDNLDDGYYETHIGIIEQRIDQAGIRLAGMLNDIYSDKMFSYLFCATGNARRRHPIKVMAQKISAV